MSNADFEKAMILLQLAEIDGMFEEAKQCIEMRKDIGFMTPELVTSFQELFTNLIKLQESRNVLIKLANETYNMNLI